MNFRSRHAELLVAQEKLKALQSLVQHESDPLKLAFYKAEMSSTALEVHKARNRLCVRVAVPALTASSRCC
jgi:hypothetical protein